MKENAAALPELPERLHAIDRTPPSARMTRDAGRGLAHAGIVVAQVAFGIATGHTHLYDAPGIDVLTH